MIVLFNFFALKKKGINCNIHGYLPKDWYMTLIISQVRVNGNKLIVPYSREFSKCHDKIEITIPPNLIGKKIKEIRIIPTSNARFFEIQYIYKTEIIRRNLDQNNALGMDLVVNNLITYVSSFGNSPIIDGKKLKSINQWFNKENSRLQSIKDKQKFGKKNTNLQTSNWTNHNNKIDYYLNKTVNNLINYYNDNISTLVVRCNPSFQSGCSLCHKNNQSFTNITFGKLVNKLQAKCELNQIRFVLQEESYTSKSSFWDQDLLLIYDSENPKKSSFSGHRTKR
ncbi:MAG: transposase [Desulfovibrionaceae bacterium]|nr:transposase [Desulfovibrionaceae bacterium]